MGTEKASAFNTAALDKQRTELASQTAALAIERQRLHMLEEKLKGWALEIARKADEIRRIHASQTGRTASDLEQLADSLEQLVSEAGGVVTADESCAT